MGKAGRPSKKDMPTGETYSQKFLAAIKKGLSEKSAAELCGISESTATEWKKDPNFRRDVLAARNQGKEKMLDLLLVACEVAAPKGNAQPIIYWLSRRTEEFREEQVAVPPGKKLTIEITDAK